MNKDKEPRVVHCSIEMELEEGRDFNISRMNLSDGDAATAASTAFITLIQEGEIPLRVIAKVIEPQNPLSN